MRLKRFNLFFGTAILLMLTTGAVFFIVPEAAQAQGDLAIGNEYVEDIGFAESSTDDPKVFIANIIRYALTFVGLIAVIYFIWAGFLWMTSDGDPAKVGRAKRALVNAAIGLAIIILAFAIVTFIINLWDDLSEGTSGGGGTTPGRVSGGIGALGNCTIESVYPEPLQTDVPRNSALIVTFREPVDPLTVCGQDPCDADPVIAENFRLFETDLGDSCEWDGTAWVNCADTNIFDVLVTSNDNYTFVFMPSEYMGSASANIWHTAYLSNDIRLPDGRGVFDTCALDYFEWQFEVSTRVDLEPPIVREGGVIPAPDDSQDTYTDLPSQQAWGLVGISGTPAGRTNATVGAPVWQGGGTDPGATVSDINLNHNQGGTLLIAVESGGTSASVRNMTTGNLLGSFAIDGFSVELFNLFTLNSPVPFTEGWSWEVDVSAAVAADTLTIGQRNYDFVSGTPGPDEISVMGSVQNNIVNTLNAADPLVSAAPDGANVRVTARAGGADGNNIFLGEDSEALAIVEVMHEGIDAGLNVVPQDRRDKPRNSVIQITFNETINPLTVSGNAMDLQDYIRVVCVSGDCAGDGIFACSSGNCVDGQFLVSNQYRVVEFLSYNECGVNACGDPVYCLPENSNLRVEIEAANLEGCVNCAAKTPYTTCSGFGHCSDPDTGENHPLSDIAAMDGVMDIALNSLDGDRSGDAIGPGAYYNENTASGLGDSYLWSFWLSDEIDISAPVIDLTTPNHTGTGVSMAEPLLINFNKVMMSASLSTGSVLSRNEVGEVRHRLLNLWNFNNYPTGYWAASTNMHIGVPDNEPEWTQAELRHTPFGDTMSYRAQAGSGVRDIYQNCFKPSDGPACTGVSEALPSCCAGTATAGAECP